jgi:hypothetical protein
MKMMEVSHVGDVGPWDLFLGKEEHAYLLGWRPSYSPIATCERDLQGRRTAQFPGMKSIEREG